jgi:hypothetical protein
MLKDQETVEEESLWLKKLMEWETKGQETPRWLMQRHSRRPLSTCPKICLFHCQNFGTWRGLFSSTAKVSELLQYQLFD